MLAAATQLEADYGVRSEVYSVTSFSELRREALECERWNMLHPGETARASYVRECFAEAKGPFVAATDYVRAVSDQIREWIPGRYVTLGTDGYGRSDSREALREHFEVDSKYIVIATLKALADEGKIEPSVVRGAMDKLGVSGEKPVPWKV